jgi:phage-related protein
MLPAINNLLVQQKGLNATQEDATALANLFGKAMMGQTGALKRAGISFTEAQEEVLKYGTEEEKAATIAEVVQQNVGNMNAEFAKTDAGKIQQAKNTLGDMGEEIGAVLLPAVADLATWISEHLLPKIQTLIEWFQQHPKIATFALALAGITAVLGPLIMIFGSLVSMIGGVITIATTLGISIGAIAAPVLAVVAAIAAAVAIGVLLYKNWDTIKAKATAVWNSIKSAVTIVVNQIKANFNTMKTAVTNVWNGLKKTASTVWNGIKTAITTPINAAKKAVETAIDAIQSKIKSVKNIGSKAFKILSGLKVPKISISGGSAPFGIGGKGTKPHISVSWNKKALENPYMFSGATLFGAGEAGDEVLYGRRALMRDIAQAVGGGSIIMNVYGSDNMSVNDLANAVEQKLIQAQKRRTQAWA